MYDDLFQNAYRLVCACIEKLRQGEPLMANEYTNAAKLFRSILDFFVETRIISGFDTDVVSGLLLGQTPQCITYRYLAAILSDSGPDGWTEAPDGCWVKELDKDTVICGVIAPEEISMNRPETYEAAAAFLPRHIYDAAESSGIFPQLILRAMYRYNECVVHLGDGNDADSAKAAMAEFMSGPMRATGSKGVPNV